MAHQTLISGSYWPAQRGRWFSVRRSVVRYYYPMVTESMKGRKKGNKIKLGVLIVCIVQSRGGLYGRAQMKSD